MNNKSYMALFIKNLFRKDTVVRAIKVMMIVAPILILINHHDHIIAREFSHKFYMKSLLTLFVPYCVSAYSSASAYTADEIAKLNNPSSSQPVGV